VIACRVRVEPSASREIDWAGPAQSFSTSSNRVSAPRAAKIAARSFSWLRRFRRLVDIRLDPARLTKARLSIQSAFPFYRSYMQPYGCVQIEPILDEMQPLCCEWESQRRNFPRSFLVSRILEFEYANSSDLPFAIPETPSENGSSEYPMP
jgi:hypothetical protein